MHCLYYQAHIDKPRTWLLVATLRSYEHVAFDRTLDKEQGVFEFFVPRAGEAEFLAVVALLTKAGLVMDIQKLPNRLV